MVELIEEEIYRFDIGLKPTPPTTSMALHLGASSSKGSVETSLNDQKNEILVHYMKNDPPREYCFNIAVSILHVHMEPHLNSCNLC